MLLRGTQFLGSFTANSKTVQQAVLIDKIIKMIFVYINQYILSPKQSEINSTISIHQAMHLFIHLLLRKINHMRYSTTLSS